MAFYTPAQTRAVDPYSSYDSDNVNQLTRIISKGKNVIAQGLKVEKVDNTHLRVTIGVVVKDDVMINISEVINIDITEGSWTVEGTPVLATNSKIYVVLDYAYIKSSPPPQASVRILKNIASVPARYQFLGCILISNVGGNPVINQVLEYDPATPSMTRLFATIQCAVMETLPPWDAEQEGQMYLVEGGTKIALGTNSSWVYFNTSSSAIDYAYIDVLVQSISPPPSPPSWTSGNIGRMIISWDGASIINYVVISGPNGWIDLLGGSGGVSSINSATGDINIIGSAGINITTIGQNISIESTTAGGPSWEDDAGDIIPGLGTIFEFDSEGDMMPGIGEEFLPDPFFELDSISDIQPTS